ncbi:class IV adenylate cyclase [Borreliella burgdorferi]|uniref:Putative adenylyl cyclase CyaB n=5 Tax=Borreliella burgdorferi TaxID=139 RepID=A0A7U8I4Q1_BORBG|nr:class IV adenylate cyclase [Borreliella burgdorferi]AGS66720.1 adenylyl cyclase CyaB, putative [Borreliella burgdorferi CA382]EEC21590.1 putative adenylyl cyclase CyaB [Borreliella burgdorferi 156a]EEE18493.1 putative adenylyl cyclase CyaB [Borreliella burgdorferi 72a]EEF83891.1 putative adenylyl cyclase CyaB [Borreliella burgdorferi CA-11.2A]EEG98854.1 putative adenylyl cyclase CyaB [Borreliella burgdorferi 118a]
MFEIESKAFIPPKELKRIIKLANKKFKFIKEEIKTDIYYSNQKKIIRIRKLNTLEKIVTFKKKILDNNHTVEINKEIEFKIDSINNFLTLIKELKFKKLYKKIKKSLIYQTNNLNVEINEIKNLGFFLEIEKIINNQNDIDLAKKEIDNIINQFGLKENIETRSYSELLSLANQSKK